MQNQQAVSNEQMLTVEDIVTNCELAYELEGHNSLAIKETAQRMLESTYLIGLHQERLLKTIVKSNSPRIILNAASMELRCSGNFVEEKQSDRLHSV